MREIIIGRNGADRSLNVIEGSRVESNKMLGTVPQSVSRQHCVLKIDQSGMQIAPKEEKHRLYVNGLEVLNTPVRYGDIVELGPDHYRLDWNFVMGFINGQIPPVGGPQPRVGGQIPPSGYPQSPVGAINGGGGKGQVGGTKEPDMVDVRHLENVWAEYKRKMNNYMMREKLTNVLKSAVPILTIGGVGYSFYAKSAGHEMSDHMMWVYGLAIFLMIVLFVISFVDAIRLNRKKEQLDEWLLENYVCPKCGHYFGKQPYSVIKTNTAACPTCKAKLIK